MTHEKDVTLQTGRTVKLILGEPRGEHQRGIHIEVLDVLIKDPKDEGFHHPIHATHPKYWKLKSMSAEKSRRMQLTYSGIAEKQIRKALKELKEMHS